MITISLCMIVRNEKDVIARCLDPMKDIADEIIMIDTGSTDGTKDICRRYTQNVFDFEWIDDFAAARNFSFSKATMDYVIWLDADDVLLDEDQTKLKQLKHTMDPSVDAVMMVYNAGFDAAGNVILSYYRERMVKRQLGGLWHEPVHEVLDYRGNILYTDICITHGKVHDSPSGRNMRIYENQLKNGGTLSPRGEYYYARELFYHRRYEDAISWFTEFLQENLGGVEDSIAACGLLSECYLALKDLDRAMQAAFRSLEYDLLHADICCQIGRLHFERGEVEKAIQWYQLATTLKKPEKGLGIVLHDCYGYIPNIQLSVCYDKLGNRQEAVRHNEIAASYKPGDEAVERNREYFNL